VAEPNPTPSPPGQPASLDRRFGALLVDWLLCLLVSGLFADPRTHTWPALLVLVAEYGFFVGLFAQTPGMRLTRVRCVAYPDGGRIGIPRAVLRGVLLCLVVPPLLMDAQRRGLHDRLAGSMVVPAVPAGR
jgi:uncharacterized RDD family membrane protein YckC